MTIRWTDLASPPLSLRHPNGVWIDPAGYQRRITAGVEALYSATAPLVPATGSWQESLAVALHAMRTTVPRLAAEMADAIARSYR